MTDTPAFERLLDARALMLDLRPSLRGVLSDHEQWTALSGDSTAYTHADIAHRPAGPTLHSHPSTVTSAVAASRPIQPAPSGRLPPHAATHGFGDEDRVQVLGILGLALGFRIDGCLPVAADDRGAQPGDAGAAGGELL